MIPKSLRWRLPISYALVALLATVALGAALLTLLQQFYRQQELNYLTGNAQTIGERIVPYVEEMDIGQLQATIKGLAFLSQTRVVVFSPDHSLLLADSGDPRLSDENTQIAVSVEVDGVEQTFGQTGATNNLSQVTESTIVIEPGLFGSVDENVVTEIIENTPTDGENLLLESEIQDVSGVITRTTIVTRQVQSEALPRVLDIMRVEVLSASTRRR